MKKIRLIKGRRGYIMPWVIILFLLVSLLSTVIVSASAISVRSTQTNHSTRQAYYSARSAAVVVVDYILKNGHDDDALAKVLNSSGSGSSDLLGDYTVEVYGISSTRIKVTATAVYRGERSTVTATLARLPGGSSGVVPNENLVFLGEGGSAVFGQGVYNGDVYINGDFTFGHGSTVNGKAIVTGDTLVDGGAHANLTHLIGFGDFTLSGSARIGGDVLTKGNVYMNQGGSSIAGNLFADGSLYMQNGSDYVGGNATIGGDAFFGGGGDRVRGSLAHGGGVHLGYGSISTFVRGGSTQLSDYQPLDLSGYEGPATLPVVAPPTPAQNPQLYQPVEISGNRISSSGSVNSAVLSKLNQIGNNSYGATITLDTGGGDISLLVKDTDFFVDKGFKYEVTGPGRVYIYLTGASSLRLGANQYMGMQVRSSNPRLFIIGDGDQTVNVFSNSALNACVYLPRGNFFASGSDLGQYKFAGVMMANYVDVGSNVKMQYSSADLTGTPLADLIGSGGSPGGGEGGEGGTGGSWLLEGWDNR